jgi:hypothetical protein
VADDKDKRVALRVIMGDKEKEITFDELVLSNNLAQEALVRLLVRKKVFKPEELVSEMEKVKKERYRSPEDFPRGK